MINNETYKYGQYTILGQESRWATIEEIKNSSLHIDLGSEHYERAGLPLLSDGCDAYVDGNDTHSLIFGATGSKKTRLFCLPLINIMLKAGESFIATDPKGELFAKTSGLAKKMGYKTVVLDFRDIGRGDCWNPLYLPYELYNSGKKNEAIALLNDFMATLSSGDGGRTEELFWTNTSRSLGLANLIMLMEYASADQANMSSFVGMCNESAIRVIKRSRDYFDDGHIGTVNYSSTLSGSDGTLQNIVVSLFSCTTVFAAQKDLCAMLSKNTFDLRNIGREKTALYIIVPDEKTTLHFLVTTFIKQAYEILIREAQKEEDLKLPVRVNFVLDEFCNIPKIPDMPSMISAARSRNMRYYLLVQSKHQLVGKYGEDADTIKGNCDNWVFLTSRELDLLNEVSELCGSVRTPEGYERRLISVSELQRLDKDKGEALIMHARQYPIITEMADIDEYEMFKGIAPVELERFSLEQSEIFDIESFLGYARYLCDKENCRIFDDEFNRLYGEKLSEKGFESVTPHYESRFDADSDLDDLIYIDFDDEEFEDEIFGDGEEEDSE